MNTQIKISSERIFPLNRKAIDYFFDCKSLKYSVEKKSALKYFENDSKLMKKFGITSKNLIII